MRAAVSAKSVELYVRQFGVLVPAKIRERTGKQFLCWEEADTGRPISLYLGRLMDGEPGAAPAQLSLLDSLEI